MTFTHALYSTLLHVSWSLQHDEEGTACPAVATAQTGQDLYDLILPLMQ